MSNYATGIFKREKNIIFINSIIKLSKGEECDEMTKNGLFSRVYEQYANALSMKIEKAPPKSHVFKEKLQEKIQNMTNISDRDRIILCIDISRSLMDEFLSQKHVPCIRSRRQLASPTKTMITETTDLESCI